ncbi:MAG: hypothetical protein LKI30_01535 [Bifidobacterium crudilactis]|nr:hypothetical protein [Bifidobacterium crudilactis]
MGGVSGDALRSVGGDGVAEVEVFGDVGGGQDDGPAEPAIGRPDGGRPVLAQSGDGPTVAVPYPRRP